MKDGDTCMLEIQVKKRGSNSSNNETLVHLDVIAGEYAEDKEEDNASGEGESENE